LLLCFTKSGHHGHVLNRVRAKKSKVAKQLHPSTKITVVMMRMVVVAVGRPMVTTMMIMMIMTMTIPRHVPLNEHVPMLLRLQRNELKLRIPMMHPINWTTLCSAMMMIMIPSKVSLKTMMNKPTHCVPSSKSLLSFSSLRYFTSSSSISIQYSCTTSLKVLLDCAMDGVDRICAVCVHIFEFRWCI
jgi:energy-coupling factor transporter transmembrane protein EcfT